MLEQASRSIGSTETAGSSAERLKSRSIDWLAFISIAIICILCFAKSLLGYFQSDDFTFIHHASQIWNGHPELFVRTLVAAWAESPYHLQYRPVYMLSFALEYPVWHGNPFGYHLTNLCLHIAASFLCYLVAKRATNCFPDNCLIAVTTGALFAAYPLHPEVVSWISGRVDVLCATFYLLSFWFFLKESESSTSRTRSAGLLCFTLALLAKEMAASLPAVLFTWTLMLDSSPASNLKQRLNRALAKTTGHWMLLAAYIAIRALILGSVVGGYAGYTGQMFWVVAGQRWLGSGGLQRLAYPLSEVFFSTQHPLSQVMHLLYLVCGAALLLRLMMAPWSRQYSMNLVFGGSWLILSFIPVIPVWFLQATLQGSRYDYIPSIALCLLLSLILWVPSEANQSLSSGWQRFHKSTSVLLIGAFLGCFIYATIGNSQAWLNAAKQSKELQWQLTSLLKRLPDARSAVILNLPKDLEGTYMFYRFDELRNFLRPPFVKGDLSEKVASLEPEYFGPPGLLNRQRLDEMIQSRKYDFYFWNRPTKVLQPANTRQVQSWLSRAASQPVVARCLVLQFNSSGNSTIEASVPPDLRPAEFAFLEISAITTRTAGVVSKGKGDSKLYTSWQSEGPELFENSEQIRTAVISDGKPHTYTIALGEHKGWTLAEKIDRITVTAFNPDCRTQFLAARLRSAEQSVPAITFDTGIWTEQKTGLHTTIADAATIHFNTSAVSGAKGTLVEISEPNSQFSQLSYTFRDSQPCKQALISFHLNATAGDFRVPVQQLPKAGWYQVRAAAVDNCKQIVGYFSDPVFIAVPAGTSKDNRCKPQ